MRLNTILPFALASAVLAAPSGSIEKRDKKTLQTAFTTVGNAANDLDAAIKAIPAAKEQSAALQAILPLAEKSTNVVTALHSQTALLKDTEAVGLIDAVALVSDSSKLVKSVQTAIDDLVAKKDVIQLAGASSLVHDQVQQQKDAAQPFLDTVTSKLPFLGQIIAKVQGKQTIAALDKGLNAFPAAGPAAESTASPGTTGSQADGGAAGTNPVTGVSSSTDTSGAAGAVPAISSSTTNTAPASGGASGASSGSSAPAAGADSSVSSSTDTSPVAAAPAAPNAPSSYGSGSAAPAPAVASPYGADGQSYPSPGAAPASPPAESPASSPSTPSDTPAADVPPPASTNAPVVQSPENAASSLQLSAAGLIPVIAALLTLY